MTFYKTLPQSFLNYLKTTENLFTDDLQSDFRLITRLRLRLEFMVLFQHSTQDMIVQWV